MDEFDDVGSSVPGQVMDDTVPHPLSSASIVTDQDQSGHGPTEPIWGSFPPITFAQLLAKEKVHPLSLCHFLLCYLVLLALYSFILYDRTTHCVPQIFYE